MELLKCTDLTKIYKLRSSFLRGGIPLKAINEVDLSINKGDVVGLVGESGCGKSTLGSIIAGIIKPTTGSIYFHGEDITGKRNRRRSNNRENEISRIQMIFQDSLGSLNPKKTLSWLMDEIIVKALKEKDIEKRTALKKDILRQVGLSPNLMDRYPRELSGGEAQRFNIALSLLLEPELLIADEAVSSLDVSIQAQVLNLINELKEKYNLTILFISHNLDVVRAMSDFMAVMYLGEIVEYGNAEEIYRNPLHPYTRVLISSIPKLTGEMSSTQNLKGEVPDPTKKIEGCPFNPRCSFAMDICKKIKPIKNKTENGYVTCHLYNDRNKNENLEDGQ